jgi:hypothetical protein
MSFFNDASIVQIPSGYKASTLYSIKPSSGAGDFSVTRATTATRVNENGLIESVAANVPRIDYTNGDCGELLVEPQRTNLLTYSEDFTNAAWSKQNTSVTSDGSILGLNAFVLTNGASSPQSLRVLSIPVNSATDYTYSIFVDVNNSTCAFTVIRINDVNDNRVYFNNSTQALTDNGGAGIVGYEAINYGGGIYRVNVTSNSSTATSSSYYLYAANAANTTSTTGETLRLTGAQREEGSYATSYIPTTSSTVSRNADVISLTNASALLGDSEGVVFFESTFFDQANDRISISDGTINNRVSFDLVLSPTLKFRTFVNVGGASQSSMIEGAANENVNYKIAVKYSTNDFAIWVDGVEVATDNSGSTFGAGVLTQLRFDNGFGGSPFYGRIRQIAVFDQALLDEELSSIAAYTSFTEIANANNYTING